MRILALIMGLLLPTLALAVDLDQMPCAEFARGAAETIYLQNIGYVQGHQYESGVTAYEKVGDHNAVVRVAVYASDGEGGWTARFVVLLDTGVCSLIEVRDEQQN